MWLKFLFILALVDEEAKIVGTDQSSIYDNGNTFPASMLLDGVGLDGLWSPGFGCAASAKPSASIEWLSLELDFPRKITRVQIANRVDCCVEFGENVHITIGPSKVYDPNEPLCRPEIPELVHEPGFQDYCCTGELHEGKFVKISRTGPWNLCEVRVFTLKGK